MPLGVGGADKGLVESPLAFEIEPGQPAAHRHLAGGLSIMMKSMNSGTPASIAPPDRSSFGMIRSDSIAHRLVLVRREELRLERRRRLFSAVCFAVCAR